MLRLAGLAGLLILWPMLAPAAGQDPAAGPPQAIGGPAAGCVQGARALPADAEGLQILRPARGRVWSHPRTINVLLGIGHRAQAEGLGLVLVGDVGLARGGPMPSGHASHQNGLDADIWFRLPRQKLGPGQLAEPHPLGMVRANGLIDPAHWGPAQARLLELAATAPGVDRIFVNPAIKATLCRTLPAGRRAWLGRLRPWWGHDSHFHIRLACPEDSPLCEAQRPVEDGDGCGEELADWLARPTMPAPPDRPHVQTKPLPAACRAILGRSGLSQIPL